MKIPSVLISVDDSLNLTRILDGKNDGGEGIVEMAIEFDLVKNLNKSNLIIILEIDNYQSYDFMDLFKDYYQKF